MSRSGPIGWVFRSAVTVPLCAFAVFMAIGSPQRAGAAAIEVPADDFTMPAKLYVLPVVYVPADQKALVEASPGTGLDLSRQPMPEWRADEYRRGEQNLGVFLHMARRKYETMLRNPLTGESRGTFRLASWDAATGSAHEVTSPRMPIQPLVVQSITPAGSIAQSYANGSFWYLEQMLDAVGCRQSTCPFVFAIAVVGDPLTKAGGRRLNHGYDNGGGVAMFNFRKELVLVDQKGSQRHFLSTLLHELGHGFGMPHVDDFCGNPRTCPPRLRIDSSPSIMGYSEGNWIYGCGFASKKASNPTGGACEYPGNAAVDVLPGELIAEDLRILGQNDRAFDDLTYERALDAPGISVYRLNGLGNTGVGTTIGVTTVDTHLGFRTPPTVLLGADDNAFPEFFEEFDGARMWHSKEVGPDGWIAITVAFPAEVDLRRIDVYSGFKSGTHVARRVKVSSNTIPITEFSNITANQTVPFKRAGTHFRIQLQAGDTGHVVLRGLRLFGHVGGQTVELYPAAEPRVVEASTGTWGGKLSRVVGSDQSIAAVAKPFEPGSSWHSQQVDPGGWVSLTVEFPEEQRLGHVKVHSGHSGTVHQARLVQVERRCVCGTDDAASCNAGSGACDGKPAGASAFELVERVVSSPDQLITFPPREARVWKIALRTPNASEQPGNPGFVTVRGLRFFRPDHLEIFPARFRPDGV